MNKKSQTLILSFSLALLSAGVFFYLRNGASGEMIGPRIGPVVEAVYGLGTVIAPQTYQVKTAINQKISEIYVKEGDQVKAGTSLIRFDEGGVNRAPFSGTVTSIPLKKGELLFPSTPALTLVNLEDLILEVSLEQQSVLRVKPGQKAIVSFESLRGERIQAKVQSVFPRDTQFIVRIMIDKFPTGILPGMTSDVAIEVGRKDNVLSIPLRAISGGMVTIQSQGKMHKDAVQVGVVDGEWAEIISGNISADDKVLVRSK
jgi:macrolide-specific efflux system membrane fusion protein